MNSGESANQNDQEVMGKSEDPRAGEFLACLSKILDSQLSSENINSSVLQSIIHLHNQGLVVGFESDHQNLFDNSLLKLLHILDNIVRKSDSPSSRAEISETLSSINICIKKCSSDGLQTAVDFTITAHKYGGYLLDTMLRLALIVTRCGDSCADSGLRQSLSRMVLCLLKSVLESGNMELSRPTGQLLKSFVHFYTNNDFTKEFHDIMDVAWTDTFVLRFTIVCTIFDWLIAPERLDCNSWVWIKIEQGICHTEISVRKQADYMLKLTLDLFDKGVIPSLTCPLLRLEAARKKATLELWSDYLLFIECLNEKQIHIIQPNFRRLEAILKAVQIGILDCRWLIALFRRVLSHNTTSVRKWGFISLFNLNFSLYPQLLSAENIEVLQCDFIELSCYIPLFTPRSDTECDASPDIYTAMKNYLCALTSTLSTAKEKDNLIGGILKTLSIRPWCPVPNLFWCSALSCIPPEAILTERSLSLILNIIKKDCGLCEPRIRHATQKYLYITALNLFQMTIDGLGILSQCLVALRDEGLLVCSSSLWNRTRDLYNTALEEKITTKQSLLHSSAREELALMCLDSSSILSWIDGSCLHMLGTCSQRAYVDSSQVLQCSLSVQRLVSLIRGDTELFETVKDRMLQRGVVSSLQYINNLIVQGSSDLLESADVYLQFIKLLIDLSPHAVDEFISNVLARIEEGSTVVMDFEWRLIELYIRTCSEGETITPASHTNLHTCTRLAKTHCKQQSSSVRTRNSLTTIWSCYHLLLKTAADDDMDWDYWYDEAMDALSVMFSRDYRYVVLSLQIILQQVDCDRFQMASECLLNKSEEDCKNSDYLPIVRDLVTCLFSPGIITHSDKTDCLQQTFSVLLQKAEERPGLANILAKSLTSSLLDKSVGGDPPNWAVESLVQLAMYGPIHNKAHRSVEATFMFLSQSEEITKLEMHNNEPRVGWELSDHEVRVITVDCVKQLCIENSSTLSMILESVCQAYSQLLSTKCYSNFPNSHGHRQRHRLLCLLLSLLPDISQISEYQEKILDFLSLSLKTELQPSCRHQLEWMYIFLTVQRRFLIQSYVIDKMDPLKMVKEKASYVCSMFSIASHLCAKTEPTDVGAVSSLSDGDHVSSSASTSISQFDLICTLLPLISPWGMSSKFHMRIHSQAALMKIWHHASKEGILEDITSRFPLFKANMEFALQSGTATEKNSRKLVENFFYFKFDPIKDWCGETIFSLWPRLLSLSESEAIPYSTFSCDLNTCCSNNDLRTCDPGTWHVKVKEGDNETEFVCGEVQQKVTVWRTTNPALEALDCDGITSCTQRNNDESLILVTSLIDKAPNLGGLCRTAEIFGVTEMVVASLKVTEDPNFLSTSVTSHQWIPLKQVPKYCLSAYLTEMKEDGYTVIGVEQATNSKSLVDYCMPARSILLLGNEKQGIPTELISLLDVCVEIPQQGVIRSLNVHVSGALLVWEYRKQRLLDNKNS